LARRLLKGSCPRHFLGSNFGGLMITRLTLATLISTSLLAPFTDLAWGSDSLLENAFQEVTSVQKVQLAYGQIHQTASLQDILKNTTVHSLKISAHLADKNLETTKFQHYYKGLEVVGSMTMFHTGVNGSMVDDQVVRFDLDTQPEISAAQAAAIAESLTQRQQLRSLPVLKILPSDDDSSANLVYFVELNEKNLEAGRTIIIDAHSGQVIANMSDEENLAPIYVYSAENLGKLVKDADLQAIQNEKDPTQQQADEAAMTKGQCELYDEFGAPFWFDPDNCAQAVTNGQTQAGPAGNDASAQRAATATQTVLEYYRDVHGRDSYDGQGSPLVGIVHAGIKYNNAFWNPQTEMMAYGDGDGVKFGDFTGSLDVIGHEITHGVTMKTAQLLMMGQSGSLNEAYSDFFGRMIANDGDWAMGRAIFIEPNSPGIRDLADPASLSYKLGDGQGNVTYQGNYPATIADIAVINPAAPTCDQSNDRCFVHINSTEASHASYLITQAIGKDKAQSLIFTTLTQKISAKTTFRTNAQATVTACGLMYDSATCQQVVQAFAQTGLTTTLKKPVALR
jgi:bacillolysin